MYQSQETSSNSTWKYVYFAARKLYETRSTTFWSVCILLGHVENITERNLKDGLLQHWIWRQTVWGSERWKEARNFCQNLCVRLEFTFLTQSQIHPDKYNQRELRFKATLGNLVLQHSQGRCNQTNWRRKSTCIWKSRYTHTLVNINSHGLEDFHFTLSNLDWNNW